MLNLLKNICLRSRKQNFWWIRQCSVSANEIVHISADASKEGSGVKTQLTNRKNIKNTTQPSNTQHHQLSTRATTAPGDEGSHFMAVFPDIIRDLTEAANKYNSRDASHWLSRALEYNVPKGKKNRGILTVLTYKNLVNSKDIKEENLKLAHILGWCVEMLQCFFIISDDIMDNSSTRRGQTCWHQLEHVGLIALNDALMIENAIYVLLKKYFGQMDCYVDLLDLFHEITFITTCGQSLDLLNASKCVTSFDMETYNAVVANKTAYYSFYLPFASAMHLAGIKDQEAFGHSKDILLEMGHFFQVQDDFLDCFGNPDITGKIGTDIEDNKCSWLAVVCMQKANELQKHIMVDCYGKKDPEKVARVKELYRTLSIPDTFTTYEKKSYNIINNHIQQTSRGAHHQVLLQILKKIYQRSS